MFVHNLVHNTPHNSVHNTPHNSDDEEPDNVVTLISKLDLSHPLHLHPNDSTTLTTVSIKLKSTENYNVWSCVMLLDLEGRNKTGFIDNTCKRSYTDEVLGRQWDRDNVVFDALIKLPRDPLRDAKGAYALISSEESYRAVVTSSGAGPSQRPNNFSRPNIMGIEGLLVVLFWIIVSHPNRTEALITKVARDSKFIVGFDESKCFLMSQNLMDMKLMGIGKQFNGLYYFDNIEGNMLRHSSLSNSSKLNWHNRLGHPSDQAKQTREPFPLSEHKSTGLGELVHLDLWGPYRNEIVERKDMHLLNVARSVLFPSSVLKGKSPYELVFNKKPSLKHLRVFGCLSFATILNNHDKFSSRAEKCVLTGYSSFKKGYKFQDLDHVNFFDEIVHEGIDTSYDDTDLNAHDQSDGSNGSASKDEMAATSDPNTALSEDDVPNSLNIKHVKNVDNQLLRSPNDKRVCKLKKSLYGLKQAPRQWNAKLTQNLIESGFKQSKSDYSLFTKSENGNFLALLVYVDDIIFGLLACKPSATPLEQNLAITNEPTNVDKVLDNITEYQKIIGKLIYLTHTRPDISVHIVKQSKASLEAFVDADWAKCLATRKSIKGFCVKLNGSLVSWRSKKQNTLAKSSNEAEYIAMDLVTSEVTWILKVLRDLEWDQVLPVNLFCDSQDAIKIAANPVFHERTKHLEIDLHFVREFFLSSFIKTQKISTAVQPTDIFTKGLDKSQLENLILKLGMIDVFQLNLKFGGLRKELDSWRAEAGQMDCRIRGLCNYGVLGESSKRRTFWSLNEDILKITILKTNTPYPFKKKTAYSVPALDQRPQMDKGQYAVSRDTQYAYSNISNVNILEDIKRMPTAQEIPILRRKRAERSSKRYHFLREDNVTMTKVIKGEFEKIKDVKVEDVSLTCDTPLEVFNNEVIRLSGMDDDLFTYEVEVANIPCNSNIDDDSEHEANNDMGYDPSDCAFSEWLGSKIFNYKTMDHYTMKALWIYWIRGDDEVKLTDEESSDDMDKVAEVFRVDTNLFDFETPVCKAFEEFNYLLKIDPDLLTNDIEGFKTYEDYKNDWIYEWNKDVPWVDEKPWTNTGVWTKPTLVKHTCKPFNYKTGCSEWPTCSWKDDGYCNGGNLLGTYIIGNQLHYQDYEWYEALENSKLKDEALRNKAIMEK
ncbi:VIER F-box protein 2 [Tanacetum coccineum]|uniref:VIER F-box protein 2 n=1 Tax=Tanacetum coccineum TaxID=301880 RepID=A0ABQ5JAX2_9ASTR